jgi:sterol desaturase/sphingolipid hydroxylase (fatty acid hydroxylase superfamily)
MNPIVFAIPVFLLTVVIEWGAARVLRRDVYDASDAVASLQLGVLSQLIGAATKVVSFGIYVGVFTAAHLFTWSTSAPVLWVLALVLYDFLYYWNHRLNHEVAVLWAGHVVHHSSERFNLTTALRQSATSSMTGWIFYLPMALLGVSPVMFAVVALIDLLYQYWVHTELIGRLGALDYVLVTPSNHRVHHGQDDYCIDRNYGGILILWDVIFGTFAAERPNAPPVTFGVRTPLASYNPFWGNVHVYVELLNEAARTPGFAAKARVFLRAPSRPGGAPTPAFDASAFKPYRPKISGASTTYVLVQYLGLTGGLLLFLVRYDGFSAPGALALALLLGMTLLAQGALLEGAGFAPPLEAARLVLVALAGVFEPSAFGFDSGAPARAGVVGAAALSMIALGFLRRTSPGLLQPAS